MDIIEIIAAKRDGRELSAEQIRHAIEGYTDNRIGDEQCAALLMAVVCRGMSRREIAHWTAAMIDTGTRMDYSFLSGPTVDKHSTGGVGDKLSLVLAPLVAACGANVPMLSGRGLGHTGGTLDKLESIPGFRASLDSETLKSALTDVGAFIAAAGDTLAPADKKIYALRDVTATVDSIALIASSIMSKKIAAGADSLVIDVKVGSGAFMKTRADAENLARTMVDLGNDAGVTTSAVLTDMSRPLGRTIGNALEVEETIDILRGGGPADVRELTIEFARRMLDDAGLTDVDVSQALDDGRAYDSFRRMIRAQGGDPDAALPVARHSHEVVADRDGYVTRMDALGYGVASWTLGAGRARKEDLIHYGAGVRIHKVVGEPVRAGEVIATLYADEPERFEAAIAKVEAGTSIGPEAPPHQHPVIAVVR